MQVIIALVVVFFVFKIPCDGPVLLFILLCLLQGEAHGDDIDDDDNEDDDDDEEEEEEASVGKSFSIFLEALIGPHHLSMFISKHILKIQTTQQMSFNIISQAWSA